MFNWEIDVRFKFVYKTYQYVDFYFYLYSLKILLSKKLMKFCFLKIFVIAIFISSCDESTAYGIVVEDQVTDSNIRVIRIDTLTTEFSTFKYDSIITSNTDRILIGKYDDLEFGIVKASSFFELLTSDFDIDNDLEYDSICLCLGYDNYFYNDTVHINTINIKRLNDEMRPDDGDYFYNTSKISSYDEILGSISYNPRPIRSNDSLVIRLNDDFGLDLFKQLQDKNINTGDQLKEYFKGLTIEPNENDNGSIIGFSTSSEKSYLRLFYSKDVEEDREESYTDFVISTASSPATFFNQIISDRNGTYLENLDGTDTNISSKEMDNTAFIQSGVGIITRIKFPHIKSLYNIPGTGTILNAKLKISLVDQSYTDNLPLIDSLQVILVDKKNNITNTLYNNDGTNLLATINYKNLEFNNIYYEINLSSYIDDIFNSSTDDYESIILLPTNYSYSVDRVMFNTSSSNLKTFLDLTYVIYDND